MNKKWIWILSGIAVVVITLLVLKQKGIIGKEEGTKVAVEKASRKDIIEVVTASGKVYPEIELKISPDISGEIASPRHKVNSCIGITLQLMQALFYFL